MSGELNYRVPDAKAAIAAVEASYAPQAATVDRTDGISYEFAEWRFNLRTSNTEPLIRLNVEARGSAEFMRSKTDELLALLKSHGAVAADALNGFFTVPSSCAETQRRHSGLQRRTGAADPVRAPVPGAAMRWASATSVCSSMTAARIAPWRCCGNSFSARPQTSREWCCSTPISASIRP